MNSTVKNCFNYLVSNLLNLFISALFTSFYSWFLFKLGKMDLITIIILIATCFVACFYIVLRIKGPRMANLKWNEQVNKDIYELRITDSQSMTFYRKSEFKQIRPCNVITKYGQYDWSDCEVNKLTFSDITIRSLSELDYKGIDSEYSLCPNIKLTKAEKNIDEINKCTYKSMEYICRFHPSDNPSVLEYQINMNPKENFDKQLFAIIRRPVKELTLRLVVSNSVLIENVYYEAETALGEMYSIEPKRVIHALSESDDENNQIYKVVIKKPKMFCKYSLSWY